MSQIMKKQIFLNFNIILLSMILIGCSSNSNNSDNSSALSGDIKIDGSSTVYPVTEAVAEEFRAVEPNVRVTVGVSGTGEG
tara:strand:- start:874 stop:1116 length:243 start_codon:yes stop_codon:yes gene_type:complete